MADSHEALGDGGRVLLSRPHYIDSSYVSLRKYDERARKKLEEQSAKAAEQSRRLLDRFIDENGCLIVKSHPFLNGKLRVKVDEDYSNKLGGGGQYVVLKVDVDPNTLGYQFWEEVWQQMQAFDRSKATEGQLDKKAQIVSQAKKDLKAKLDALRTWAKEDNPSLTREEVEEIAQGRLEGILQEEVYTQLKTPRTDENGEVVMPLPFENNEIAIKIAKDTPKIEKAAQKEKAMVGYNKGASVFTPLYVTTKADRAVFIMEHVTDQLSLDEIVNETTLDQKIDIVIDVVEDVLTDLSRMGGVHRDIKPTNVMVIRDKNGKPRPKVGDYGVLRIYTEKGTISSEKTYSGGRLSVGTPMFFSPKHVTDPEHLDFRDDLYSLFATLYVWLTGKTPNPIKPTGDIDGDAGAESINVGWKPTDTEKILPVNPYNLMKGEVVETDLRLTKDPNRKWYKPWTWWGDPLYLRTSSKIKKKLHELCLVMAKAMMYDEKERHQTPRQIVEDLKAVRDGKQAPHTRATLAETTDHYKLRTQYNKESREWEAVVKWENVLRPTKPHELLEMVFSKSLDPFYEKDKKSPNVQRELRKERLVSGGICAAAGLAVGSGITYLLMQYGDVLKNLF
ncbi:protein kinase [Candidatus Woesearchaeota archaeon]|nr:protein kinase [Candidatus Woesearchaeota archaeon]